MKRYTYLLVLVLSAVIMNAAPNWTDYNKTILNNCSGLDTMADKALRKGIVCGNITEFEQGLTKIGEYIGTVATLLKAYHQQFGSVERVICSTVEAAGKVPDRYLALYNTFTRKYAAQLKKAGVNVTITRKHDQPVVKLQTPTPKAQQTPRTAAPQQPVHKPVVAAAEPQKTCSQQTPIVTEVTKPVVKQVLQESAVMDNQTIEKMIHTAPVSVESTLPSPNRRHSLFKKIALAVGVSSALTYLFTKMYYRYLI